MSIPKTSMPSSRGRGNLSNAERQTPNAERPMQSAERQTANDKFGVRRSAFGVRRSAFGVRRSAFGVRRSAFGVRRSAFGVRRSAFGVRRSAFGVRRSAFGVRRWAFGALRPAFGKLPLPFFPSPDKLLLGERRVLEAELENIPSGTAPRSTGLEPKRLKMAQNLERNAYAANCNAQTPNSSVYGGFSSRSESTQVKTHTLYRRALDLT